MELDALDIILALLAILSAIWAFVSEQFRILAVIIAFTFLAIVILSKQSQKISEITSEQKRINEKLKIHEQLINIKADIRYLEREVIKNEKRK